MLFHVYVNCENPKAWLSLTWRTGCPGERHIWICLHCSSSTPPPQRVKPPRATKGIPDHYDYSSYDQWTWPKMKNLNLCPHYRVQAWPLPLASCHLESFEARSARKDHNFQAKVRKRSDFLLYMCTVVRACWWALLTEQTICSQLLADTAPALTGRLTHSKRPELLFHFILIDQLWYDQWPA